MFFLRILCEIELSLQSGAHFAHLIFQNCSERDSLFKHVEVQIELSLQSGAHFADLIFQKCSEHDRFCDFEVQIAESGLQPAVTKHIGTAARNKA